MATKPAAQTVEVYAQRHGMDDKPHHVATLSSSKFRRHSAAFARSHAATPGAESASKVHFIVDTSPAALEHIAEILKALPNRQGLHLALQGLSFKWKIALWHACHVLEIRPQGVVKDLGHKVNWILTHTKLTPEMIETTWECTHMWQGSDDAEKTKIWKTLVQQCAWDIVHGKFTKEEEEKLRETYSKTEDLREAMEERIRVLTAKSEALQRQRERNHQRRNESRRAQHRRAGREKVIREVVAGLRPINWTRSRRCWLASDSLDRERRLQHVLGTKNDTVTVLMKGKQGRFGRFGRIHSHTGI